MKTCEKMIACGLAAGFLALLFLILQNMKIPFDPFLQSAILEFRAPLITRLPEFNSSILIKHEKKSRKPREIAVFYLQSPRVNGIIY